MALVPPQPRRHLGSNGYVYDVMVVPVDGLRGVSPGWWALAFTRERDAAILTVEVPSDTDLRRMAATELDDLLARTVADK
jgi:hypothetical protein